MCISQMRMLGSQTDILTRWRFVLYNVFTIGHQKSLTKGFTGSFSGYRPILTCKCFICTKAPLVTPVTIALHLIENTPNYMLPCPRLWYYIISQRSNSRNRSRVFTCADCLNLTVWLIWLQKRGKTRIIQFSVAQVSLSRSLHVQIIIVFYCVVHTIAEELLRSF